MTTKNPQPAYSKPSRPGRLLRRGLREQIVDELRDDLISGRMQTGEQLVERQLAARFGVSHAPIREALLQLTLRGMLVSQPHAGVRVAPPTSPAVRALLAPIRLQLETYAVDQINGHLDRADFDYLEELVACQRHACEQRNRGLYVECDFALHQFLVECRHCAEVLGPWLSIASRARIDTSQGPGLPPPADPMQLVDQHATIVAALVDGDRDEAVALLEANLAAELGAE